MPDVFNGSQPGNFGWLTWTGASSVPSLVDGLTPPRNSDAYTNPNDSSDHIVSVGDPVQGRPGVENASEVRDALDTLKTRDIVVPVWDNATESGRNTLYRVVSFARTRILDYRLPGENRITARFLGSRGAGDRETQRAADRSPRKLSPDLNGRGRVARCSSPRGRQPSRSPPQERPSCRDGDFPPTR